MRVGLRLALNALAVDIFAVRLQGRRAAACVRSAFLYA